MATDEDDDDDDDDDCDDERETPWTEVNAVPEVQVRQLTQTTKKKTKNWRDNWETLHIDVRR